MKHIISLGAGVQSSTMALMAAVGEIVPMPEAAIFADTQAEPQSVYTWLAWLEERLPFPVYRATYGSLYNDGLQLRVSQKSGKRYSRTLIPLFVKDPNDGKTRGMMPRKCTRDYKVYVIHRQLKKLLGLRRILATTPLLATQWIGISRDEIIRMKPSGLHWVENRHPLIEMGITRADCLKWMEVHGYPKPPRSACVFCPYHSDSEWVRLRDQEPEDFARAVEWERSYQAVAKQDEVLKGEPFLHDSLVPLDKVNFSVKREKPDQFGNECEGMCGV